MEALEPRLLLSGAHEFARFVAAVDSPGVAAEIVVTVSPEDFELNGGSSILSLRVTAGDGSGLDPAAVQVMDSGGQLVKPKVARDDLDESNDSLVLVDLEWGQYTLSVLGHDGTTGLFELGVGLVGDLNGDRVTDDEDKTSAKQLLGARKADDDYLAEADADLNGHITGADFSLLVLNQGDGTSLEPLALTIDFTHYLPPQTLGDSSYSAPPPDPPDPPDSSDSPASPTPSMEVWGTTLPGIEVYLDTDEDGFSDATATSDAAGSYGFLVPMVESAAPMSVFVTDGFGQVLTAAVGAASQPGIETSALWGLSGELWDNTDPLNRLPDFSYAGYRAGETNIPTMLNQISVLSYGADGVPTGDPVADDDTTAFLAAIADAQPGDEIFIPNGTYHIRDLLRIEDKGHWILKGESMDGVKIFIDRPGSEAAPEYDEPRFWSFDGAFFWVVGSNPANETTLMASIVSDAPRGAQTLTLDVPVTVAPGQWIQIVQTDPDASSPDVGTLQRRLHGDFLAGDIEELHGVQLVRFASRVTDVSGNTITLERPLPVDVDVRWQPQVHLLAPTVEEVGIENMTIEFEHTMYPGHFNELGYNAIMYTGTVNSWIRNVKILNADYGIFLRDGAMFNTLNNITIDVTAPRYPAGAPTFQQNNGHRGLGFTRSQDNIIANFEVRARYIHDLSITWYDRGNVFSNGSGLAINMDHHRAAPYQNLFTGIDLGSASRAFRSGGSLNRGPHSAAYNTYWNVSGTGNFQSIDCSFGGGHLNFVATANPGSCDDYDWFTDESLLDPSQLIPQNIHEAQAYQRLGAPVFLAGAESLVLEAEHFDVQIAAGDSRWELATDASGYSGSGYLVAPDGSGDCLDLPCQGSVAELRYQVYFETPGTYDLWVRGNRATRQDDSLHVGLNNEGLASADRIALFQSFDKWVWTTKTMDQAPDTGQRLSASIDIPSAGVHTINVWVREDGFKFDKLYLTQDGSSPKNVQTVESLRRDPLPSKPHTGTIAPVAVAATSDDGHVPANTLDGDLSTRWSAFGDGESIIFDLGAIYTIGEVQIAWFLGDTRTASFDVLTSIDGVNYDPALLSMESSGESLELESYVLGVARASRYVKIVGHENSSNGWNSITEVAILAGEHLA